jgi:hypothetical protein
MKRWLRGGAVLLFVLTGVCGAYRYGLYRLIESELAAIRQRGEPVSLAELDRWYPPVPAGENAAEIYLEAFQLLRQPKPDEQAKLPAAGAVDAMRDLLGRQLAENAAALARFHQAAARQQCRYPVDFSQGHASRLPHLTKISTGVRLLAMEATFAAEHGDRNKAATGLRAALALAQSVADEPTEISQLTRAAGNRNALLSLPLVLTQVELTDEQLGRLSTALARADDSDALVRGAIGERCFAIDLYRHPELRLAALLDRFYSPALRRRIAVRRAMGVLDIWLLHYLDQSARYLELCRQPVADRIRNARSVAVPYPFSGFAISLTMRLAGDMTPVELNARHLADVGLGLAGLAVERYRLARGQLPATLAELVPALLSAVPVDPFDGKPVRYWRSAKGYVLYSVGFDGRDDGGDEKKDITFIVAR